MFRLTFHCRFIAHSYSGVRLVDSSRAELDWPPAPARLHQALVAATLANLPGSLRDAYAEDTLTALRWLETVAPPEIVASKLAVDEEYRRALLVAMPHNSPAKGDFSRYHPDLAPVFHATPKHGGCLQVAFQWSGDTPEFHRKAEQHLPALKDAVAKLRYLGRGEDRVECEVSFQTAEKEEPIDNDREIWRPASIGEDVRLLTARANSTAELRTEFARERMDREAKRPARLFLSEQGYARDAAAGLLPVHVAIFQIFREPGDPDELPVACDAVNAHRWRSPLRALACKAAEKRDRWNDPTFAAELISGHRSDGKRTDQPHLAFVPLPSLSLHGKADGRARRFALLGYASPREKAAVSSSIYRTLASSLDGAEIESGFYLRLIEERSRDKVWKLYTGSSRTWISATPVVIDRGYKVPTHSPDGQPLSSNERHLRRLSEWTNLVRASLRHIQLPDDLAAGCKITLTPSPLLAATARAERYRPAKERAPFLHARLEFSRPVRGPLLLGDRRYLGLGLFVPANE